MLTKKEFKEISESYDNNKKMSAKQLLAFIEKSYVKGSTGEETFGSIRQSMKTGITVIDPNHGSDIVDETRKAEIKKGAKVRTKAESSNADDFRKS